MTLGSGRALAGLGALGVFVATRLIALPEPIGIDQGIFATAGWGLTRGLQLYRDVWDQKPPGIHLTYAAGFLLMGAHPRTILFLDTIAGVLTCTLLYVIASRLVSRACGWAAALAFSVGTYPAFAWAYGGFLERAVAETFIAPLIAGAAWCVTRTPTSTLRYAVMGLLIGVAAAFKPTALVYWPALLLFVWWDRPADFRRALVTSVILLPAAWLIIAAWLWRGHALHDAWIAIVEYNQAYVTAGSGILVLADRLAHEIWRLIKTDPLWLTAAAAGLYATWQTARARLVERLPLLCTVWLAAAVLAIAANGVRMYATYFIPAACPLALLAGWFIAARRSTVHVALVAIVFALAAGVAVRSHYPDRLVRFVAADIGQLRSLTPRDAYLELFGGYASGRGYSARANAELSEYLAARTAPDESIYIFGMAPSVYFIAKRLPADRFVWTYPGVVNLVHRDEFTVDALAARLAAVRPAYVVLERNNRDSASGWRIEDAYTAPSMKRVLDAYDRETEIEDFTLMRRR